MKKLFTIIAVASMMLTSVFGFTSCQKDELPAQTKTQQSVTVTSVDSQYDGNGTILNTGNKETSAYEADPFTNMSGTWEYVDADGTKCTLELSNETKHSFTCKIESNGKKYALNARYEAKLTVGDKTYEGKFLAGIFLPNADKSYCITAQKYVSSVSANSFNADIKVNDNLTAQGVTLTKVN